jgi:hemerythrin-like domain-containing protein
MDPIKLLKDQHALVKRLFNAFAAAEGPDDQQEIFEQIADNFAAHATIEEKLFYPAAYVGALKDQLTEAVEEHLSAKRLIADLLAMTPDVANYEAKVRVLQEQIEHHVEEEEGELFPKARKLLADEPINELGDAMQELFVHEMKRSPRDRVPAQTDEAAPLD